MSGPWELWSLDSANLMCDFGTEAEALKVARDCIEDGYSAELIGLADDGTEDLAISGDALLARIREVLG